MKIDFIIVSAIMVMIVILPFFLLQNSTIKQLKKRFNELVTGYNLTIDQTGNWNTNMIGLDSAERKLLIVQKPQDNFEEELVELDKVKEFNLVVTTYPKTVNGKTEDVLQRVEFNFSFLSGKPNKLICLYDNDITCTQDLELKHAQEWSNIISMYLKKPVLKKAA